MTAHDLFQKEDYKLLRILQYYGFNKGNPEGDIISKLE